MKEKIAQINSNGSTTTHANFNLKIGSFNIHGQGKTQLKLRKIKGLFTKGNFDILLLQETRSDGGNDEFKRWKKIFNLWED